MPAPDRRTFLRAAGGLTAGLAADPGAVLGQPPSLPGKPEDGLKPLNGDGLMALPAGASRRLGDQKMRILGHVNAIQFSPRGTTLVSATSGELRGWDPRTGKVLFRLNFPSEASVDSGRLTSRDTFVLMVRPNSGGNQELRHFAFGTGKLLSRSPALKFEHPQRTAYSVDGALLAVVHTEAIALHDTTTGAEKWRQTLPAQSVGDCQFFPDGSTVAVGIRGEVKLFETATGKPGAALNVGTIPREDHGPGDKDQCDHLSNLAVSADGKCLAASYGEDEDHVICWDVKATAVKHRLVQAGKPIGFVPDGSELATVHHGVVTFWSMATGKATRRFEVPKDDMHLSPDGKMLAAEAGDSIILIDAATGKHLPHSADPPGNPTVLSFDGPHRLRGRLDQWGGWVEWDVRTGTRTLIRPPGVAGRVPLTLTADGRVGLYRHEGEYTAYAMATGNPIRSVQLAEGSNESLALALTPDGRAFVSPTEDGLAVNTNVTRRVIPRTGGADGQVASVATDGRTAAVGYRNGGEGGSRLDLYDLTAGRHLHVIRLNGDAGQLAFSSDGTRLVVAHDAGQDFRRGRQSTTSIFDVRTGKAVFRTEAAEDFQDHAVAVSLDGRMLAQLFVGDEDRLGHVQIWEIASGHVRKDLEVGKNVQLNAAAFSPDGRTLAVSVNGGPVFLWDLYAQAPVSLTDDDLECAWSVLKDSDSKAAFTAIRLLVQASGQAIKLFAGEVPALVPPDPKVVAQHIADLDHKEFRKREAAARALAELGERAREPMAQALAAGPSPEARGRLERLLAAEERPSPDMLRRLRAIEVAEVIGTPAAAALLTSWGGGAPGAMFTSEAAAAAKRVVGRSR